MDIPEGWNLLMAYTKATDVGNGLYRFEGDDGQAVTLGGQAAAEQAAALSGGAGPAPTISPDIAAAATAPKPDERLAGNFLTDPTLGPRAGSWLKDKFEGAGRSVMDAASGGFMGSPASAATPPVAQAPAAPEPAPTTAPQMAQQPQRSIAFQPTGGGAPAQRVPGQWVPHSMQIQKGEELPQNVKDRYERGFLMQQHAEQDAAAVAKDRAYAEMDAAQGQQDAAEQHAAEQRQKMQEQQGKLAQIQQRYEQMANDIGSQKVDPDQFWANKSTGARGRHRRFASARPVRGIDERRPERGHANH